MLLFFLAPVVVFAQQHIFAIKTDTLTYDYRTGGKEIDSLDWYHTGQFYVTPGGPWNNIFGINGTDYASFLKHFSQQQVVPTALKSYFTALPHLGFSYSFGGKGIQYLNAEYQQSFKKNTNLSVQYKRNSTGSQAPFLRNAFFSNESLQFLVHHQGKKYKQLLEFDYLKSNRNLSGGITTDTLIQVYGLEFTPVYKKNAASSYKYYSISSQHVYGFKQDSVLNHGLIYKNQLKIQNRVYTESDSLAGIYSVIHIDSLKTRDQFQLARINNSFGYFFKSKKIAIDALLQHGYWRFQNLGTNRDTNEVEFQCNIATKVRNWTLSNSFNYGIVGIVGQWSDAFNGNLTRGKWKHSIQGFVGKELPTIFQRAYFANTSGWKLQTFGLQGKKAIDYQLQWQSKLDLTLIASYRSYANTYFYLNSNWRNDTLNSIQSIHLTIRSNLNWRSWTWQPQICINSITKSMNYLPLFDLRSKLFFNKKLFKAQKLNYILGVDLKYQANYALMSYNSSLDLWVLPSSNQTHKSFLGVDFFTGFQIDVFRFYLKIENMDYWWNKSQSNLIQQGFPITPAFIRLGFTWDFFN